MPPRPRTGTPRNEDPLGVHVALLRGINVSGKHLVPMAELAALFTKAGCAAVQTYIQSGNVVFQAKGAVVEGLATRMARQIEARFGFQVPVVLRSGSELEGAMRANPFLAEGAAPESLHLMFLAETPTAAATARLDPKRSPTDRFALIGREIYLCCPNGLARTKLTNDYFDRALATISTVRNWRTVTKLVEMTRVQQ